MIEATQDVEAVRARLRAARERMGGISNLERLAQARKTPGKLDLGNFERLLHLEARRAFNRAKQIGLTMEYEDVFQIMSMAYAKAMRKFDETKGYAFSTYLVTICRREFNRQTEKPIEERVEHGVRSMAELTGSDPDAEGWDDVSERLAGITDPTMNPEQALLHKERIEKVMRWLSFPTKIVLELMLKPTPELNEAFKRHQEEQTAVRKVLRPVGDRADMNLSFVLDFLKFDTKARKLVRNDIGEMLGEFH